MAQSVPRRQVYRTLIVAGLLICASFLAPWFRIGGAHCEIDACSASITTSTGALTFSGLDIASSEVVITDTVLVDHSTGGGDIRQFANVGGDADFSFPSLWGFFALGVILIALPLFVTYIRITSLRWWLLALRIITGVTVAIGVAYLIFAYFYSFPAVRDAFNRTHGNVEPSTLDTFPSYGFWLAFVVTFFVGVGSWALKGTDGVALPGSKVG